MKPIAATVPGSVHSDLHAAGVIPDPFSERFEFGMKWVDETDWTYRCKFDWTPDPVLANRVLRFAGLDTVATVWLNGQKMAESDNFYLPLEVNVDSSLREGENILEVRFQSAVNVGEVRRKAFFEQEGLANETFCFDERAFVRKPGCMSGWDWSPRLVSCGIFRPVELLEFRARILGFSVLQTPLSGDAFKLKADFDVEGDETPTLSYNGRALPAGTDTWEVHDDLWWPNGEGRQALQTVTLSLPSGDCATRKIGLRTIKLLREKDPSGTTFEFEVNGVRVWARGANWIPNDCFPGAVSGQDVAESVRRCATLGMNMLRVWGGGQYETEEFYDACDAAGILVWQDFPYACSYYPDDAEHMRIAEREAQYHILRLKDRASLALWCGNNENRSLWYGTWGGSERTPPRFYGAELYDVALKRTVAEFDPGRPYIESSPLLVSSMPGAEDAPLNSDDHYWDVWHGRGDWVHYKDSLTRFSSEFGFVSSCSMAAWRTISPRRMDMADPTLRSHDKSEKPWDVFRGMVTSHYPEPATLEDWVFVSQLNQRDAMRAALEHYRSGDICRGTLIWQFNDCWPAQSWALEDYLRLTKPAGFELTRLYAGTLLCAGVEGEILTVHLANDTANAIEGDLVCEAFDTRTGASLETRSFQASLTPQSRKLVAEWNVGHLSATKAAIRCRFGGLADRWVLLCEPKDLEIAPIELSATVRDGRLAVNGTGLVVDLVVWNDEDASVLADGATSLRGFAARSAVDLEFHFKVCGPIGTLRARSLAGCHVVRLSTEHLEGLTEG